MQDNSSYAPTNWTNNVTLVTPEELMYNFGTLAQIVNVTISVLAIVVNGFVLRCLQTHQAKFSEMIFQQTVSLYVTNLIAGLTPMTSTLTLIEGVNTRRKWCRLIVSFTNAAQFAVLLNLCFLTIRRWLVLRKASVPTARTDQRSRLVVIFYIALPWLVSSICIAPTIWSSLQDESSINGCLSESVQTGEASKYTMYLFSAINAGSLLLMTAVSIGSILILWRLKKVNGNNFQNRRQQQHQRALKLLVVALGVALLTSLPSILMLFLGVVAEVFDDRRIMYIVSRSKMLNTILNSVVYSVQMHEMRSAVKEKFCARS